MSSSLEPGSTPVETTLSGEASVGPVSPVASSAAATPSPLPVSAAETQRGASVVERLVHASSDIADFAARYFDHLRGVLSTIDPGAIRSLEAELEAARAGGHTVFVAGNGGSSTTAATMANDLGFDVVRKTGVSVPFRVQALTENASVVTAIANDVGYDDVFVSQLRVHYREGDRLVVISASGNSPNVVRAAEWTQARGGRVIGLLGFDGGRLASICDVVVHARTGAGEYGPVEDAHLILNHVLAHWFQTRLKENGK